MDTCMASNKQGNIANFTPTKRFFVDMLTRDIDLEDAILDLLDNCLDGVARSQKKNPDEINYQGYEVNISFDKKHFIIEDNCGGIPSDSAEYAFRMGRPSDAPDEKLATVGVYGIGMKRSIFKMGQYCEIETQHSVEDAFKVVIEESWLASDKDWEIPMQKTLSMDDDLGTKITIKKLHKSVSDEFSSKAFSTKLTNKVVYAYSYIINKGFSVKINGAKINPNPINLRYEDIETAGRSIQPYIYKATIDDVEVKLIVGFNAPLVTDDIVEQEKKSPTRKTENAGWTIVCNDRIVVYRDKTELTGWGTDFARYHTQFIGISGIVYFKSNYPEKLPITTTKRGIDTGSRLFLKIRKHIIEGTKIFIDYTNKWKGNELIKKSNERLQSSKEASPLEIIEKFQSNEDKWTKVQNRKDEIKFRPELPVPESVLEKAKKLSFSRKSEDIELVADYLSLDEGYTPTDVGEACFDFVYKEALK